MLNLKRKKNKFHIMYSPDNWAIHIVVLYNVIANIRNVAKLCSDDEIFNARGDVNRRAAAAVVDLLQCAFVVCLRLMLMPHPFKFVAVDLENCALCVDHIIEVFLQFRRLIATQLLNLVVC